MPAGRCRCSPRRRAFLIPFLRRHDRFDCDGREFAAFCPLAPTVLHRAGVHFLFCFSAGAIVSTVTAGNLPPFARWPLLFFIVPACIFNPVSPPAWSFWRRRRGICFRVPASRCRCSPRRRAFLMSFHRRRDRLDGGGEEFVSVCPLASALLHHTGVHF